MISTKSAPPAPVQDAPLVEIDVDPDVELFCRLVQSGIERWIEAGKILCKARLTDPAIFLKITNRAPYLTRDILLSFQRIGEKKLYPYLLLDASPACQKLSLLPYDRQVELYGKPVRIAFQNADGNFESYEASPHSLTKPQAEQVFSSSGVRSIEEQKTFLQSNGNRATRQRSSKRETESTEVPSTALAETPKESVKRLLLEINGRLLEVREFLGQVAAPIPDQYDWIELTMKAMTKLRRGLDKQ